MKIKNLLFILCLLSIVSSGIKAQTVLYSENFNGATHTWTLNTSDAGSNPNQTPTLPNYWAVNNDYVSAGGNTTCFGMEIPYEPFVTIPNQPAGITGGPTSNYLHPTAVGGNGGNESSGYFGVDGFGCTEAANIFSKMSSDISTTGIDNVEIKFWWIGNGATESYVQLFYSIDAGSTWTQVDMGTPDHFTQAQNWKEETVSIPAFANQATLRIGFRLMNAAGSENYSGQDFGYGFDDIQIIDTADPISNEITTGVISPLSYCAEQSVNVPFTAEGVFNSGNVFTAQLSNAAGSFAAPVSIGTLASITPGTISATIPAGTVAGTGYRIRVVSSAPVATGTVNASDITILAAPVAGNITSSSSSVCANGTATLNISGNTGNIQWQKSSDGTTFTNISGQTGASLTSSPLTTPTYFKAVITNSCGSVETNSVEITIATSIVVDINMNPASGSLCTGEVVLSVAGNYSSFNWSNGQTGNTITVTEPGEFCGEGIDVSGCPVVANCVNTIEAEPLPINITPSGDVIICNGTLTLSATSGFVSYAWTGGGTGASLLVTEEGSYTVTGIDANGCESVSEPANATIGNTAVLNVSPPNPAICSGQPITLTADTGFSNYQWSSGQSGATITVSEPGVYTVTGVSPGGCSGISPVISVASGQDPVSNFNYNQPNSLTASFNNTSQNANNYFWDFDGLGTSEIQSPVFNFPSPGIYYVKLTTDNSCGEDDIVKIVSISSVGIDKLDGIAHIALFPNPIHDVLNMAFEFATQGKLNVDVFSMSGKQITSRTFNGNGFMQETFDFSNLSSGLYIIRLVSGNSVSYAKVIKR